MLSILGNIDPTEAITELKLSNGRILRLPTSMLHEEDPRASTGNLDASVQDGTRTIPIIEEELKISKRIVPTAHVRIQKSVNTYDVQLDEPLAISSVRIQKVSLGHVVDAAPTVRNEGNTVIYPVLEERLVITKELVLVEEIRVTNEFSELRDTQVVSMRREHLDVTRESV